MSRLAGAGGLCAFKATACTRAHAAPASISVRRVAVLNQFARHHPSQPYEAALEGVVMFVLS
ncbi:hypothetical protein [Xanthomonas citri]|uniref:hypothetical protein n=1 Tax=Xanthomonas citri TaxID=346 RepID=UPI001597B4DA|nr:hypothetical protein [Xanthomonas citri]MDS0760870.1 hypothetical protein [Xanthomonas citri pv. punicae]MDS0764648.1 hypothetical protein [Xanthomonas citri pv. punicae]MDS0799411.1 hypothetical protein [Xanthomonas citri pv. punicae]MDS0839878.1 hypothetical protein [Xanthomonas citri pv. punicae]MDS0843661.1 hypothetical protein [Xanthomonas citri pv. punicae]